MNVDVPIGDLLTDGAGRLIVLGGFGKSRSPSGRGLTNFANNDGWCDDVSDGPVRATIQLNGGAETVEAEPARVIVAPPDFAPPIENVVTLYDVVYNIATKLHPLLAVQEDGRTLSFASDIYPILSRSPNLHWVSDSATRGHGPGRRGHFLTDSQMQLLSSNDKSSNSPAFRRRNTVFMRLQRPLELGGNQGDMPRLPGGDTSVTLTEVQYKLMEKWASGEFEADWAGHPPKPSALDDVSIQDQPAALDRAALESCAGGGFYPGIEAGQLMRELSTYDQNQPLRISLHLAAGALTAGMAVPWQADFRACDEEDGSDWWPGQRPVEVFRGQRQVDWVPSGWGFSELAEKWSRLGFVVKEEGTDRYLEDERSPTLDNEG
jgi:hypothetical protein